MTTALPDTRSATKRHADGGTSTTAGTRPTWRAVAIPSEHGGWGLTAEPIVLGLVIAFSVSGLAIGVAAMLAFLVRTPLKLALVDRRRNRLLDRTRLARRIAAAELLSILALALFVLVTSGWAWLIPIAIATPFIGLELWYDVRSRGRRLVPEVSGSVGIAAVAAAIIIAANGSRTVAAGASLILAARAIASIPFVRTQIARLRHGVAPLRTADALQLGGVIVAAIAVVVEPSMIVGAVAVTLLAAVQTGWMRHSFLPPAKVLGMTQLALGLAIVAATSIGALTLT